MGPEAMAAYKQYAVDQLFDFTCDMAAEELEAAGHKRCKPTVLRDIVVGPASGWKQLAAVCKPALRPKDWADRMAWTTEHKGNEWDA